MMMVEKENRNDKDPHINHSLGQGYKILYPEPTGKWQVLATSGKVKQVASWEALFYHMESNRFPHRAAWRAGR